MASGSAANAVFRREIDACADGAPLLTASHDPDQALELSLQRYTQFLAPSTG